MFGFWKKKKIRAPIESPFAKRLSAIYRDGEWQINHNATTQEDWIDFEDGKHNFDEYAEGIIWISAINIFNGLFSIKDMAVSAISSDQANFIFSECVFFLCFSIETLARKGFLNANSGNYSRFSDFGAIYNVIDKLPENVAYKGIDFGDMCESRRDFYSCEKLEVIDYWKALPNQFSKAIRYHVDNPANKDVFNDVGSYHPYTDHNLMLGLEIQTIGELALFDCIDSLKRVLYEYSDD